MIRSPDSALGVCTQVKDQALVALRHRQIADAAVRLFIKKGYHKTTTREIAAAARFSVGSLYEYVASKEDVLFLVCNAIHSEMERRVTEALERASNATEVLAGMIREYFLVCDRMSKHILLIYQETQSLPAPRRKQVLEKEVRITGLFEDAINRLVAEGVLPPMDGGTVALMAQNIAVMGHAWALRGWFLARHYTIDTYIKLQTAMIMDHCANGSFQQREKNQS